MNNAAAIGAVLLLAAPLAPAFAAEGTPKTDLGGYKYDGAQPRATYLYRFQ